MTRLLTRFIVQSVVWLAVMCLALFVPAGNWRWVQAWTFMVILALASIGFGGWLLRSDPRAARGATRAVGPTRSARVDRVFAIAFVIVWFGWLVLMALDAQAWRTSEMPALVNWTGGALVAAGFAATIVVFRANSFAAPVVRVQTERVQRVIDTGPYALVHHPMHTAALVYIVGMPLLLGSRYGLLVVPLYVMALGFRAMLEERLLRRDLPGYARYTTRVRYRLVPGVW